MSGKLRLPVVRPGEGDEFPEGAFALEEGQTRREFIQLMGASLALAGLQGCRRPEEQILPYGRAPEEIVPGRPQRYASAMAFAGSALGVVVESHEGRPTKIEGNPLHPDSRGGAHAFAQAAVLELYDPDRSTSPRAQGEPRSWDDAFAHLAARAAKLGDGKALAVITEAHRSPTLQTQLDALVTRFPKARIVRYEPFAPSAAREGARLAFGRALEAVYEVERAKVIATLDGDLLQSVKHARGYAEGRREPGAHRELNRLYAIESAFTITGAAAEHRLRVRSFRVHALALALAHAVGVTGLPAAPSLSAEESRFVTALGRDLVGSGAGLVVAGELQPPAVHALAHLINRQLAAPVRFVAPFARDEEGPAALVALAQAMKKGEIDTAILLGGNPVYDAPADADFAAALAAVPHSVHLSLYLDETSRAAGWHLNRAHWLESWGDVRAEDGTLSIVQPLIAPLHGGKTEAEVLERLLGGTRTAYQLVQASFPEPLALRRTLHDGLLAGSAAPPVPATPRPTEAWATTLAAPAGAADGLELTFRPDAHAWDGRFANNGWLQELPDPMTKLTWDNAALIAPATAGRLGLRDGDLVALTAAGATLHVAVAVLPGQAEGSLALSVGQGRRHAGRVGDGIGFDANVLRASTGFGFTSVTLEKLGRRHELACTQEYQQMAGRPLVRSATREEAEKDPGFAKEPDREHPPLTSLWKEHEYHGHKWAMAIDLESCIGCNACMVACQAENNIPLVGKIGVLKSREMHWIRVDRYFVERPDGETEAVWQPISCQQCEQAPCEQVCPVGATTHSPEGLNDMAYNRCIGTRYCANNCPFKVRRFNFFNYNKDLPESRKLQFNPDVTVRTRGVMEKCTYCVQRINGAKIDAHKAGRERVADGAIVTACQQTCPTRAIVFGDLNDPSSEIARRAADERSYVLLEELNLRPRTSFLARVRNPNPELG